MNQGREKNEYNAATYIYWKNQIEAAESWRDKFNGQGDKIVARYRGDDNEYNEQRYNILYSNTETLAPVVYSSAPVAEVRAENSKRTATRKGAGIIEDAINYYVEHSSFQDKARAAVGDFLLSGMGIIRPKYIPFFEEEDTGEEILEKKVFEAIDYDYVDWKDFLFPECATWDDVPWIAFKSYCDYDECAKLFGDEKASQLKYEPHGVESKKYPTQAEAKAAAMKACVYEIWDKHFRERLFWSEGMANAPLEISDDPLELDGFWPVPRPLLSITTSGTLLPVPFYKMYQDQAIELDRINARIYHILDNMRRRGVYDAGNTELANMGNLGDNEFLPISNWTDFATKGGLAGVMQVEDISSYANVLQVLIDARDKILNDIYQIIGISDIRRAQTDPRETLGAQKLKSRYGTIRISTYQRKVAEFMRDLLRLTGEIIVRQFDASTLAVVTSTPLKTTMKDVLDEQGKPTGEREVDEVGAQDLLVDLRDKEPMDISINVQTDSTIIEDEEDNRNALREAISSLSEFTQIAPALAQGVGVPATAKIGMAIIERFKLGRDVQQDMQDYLDDIEKNGLPQQESPEQAIAKAEVEKAQINAQLEQMKMQLDAQIEVMKLQVKQEENALKARELGIDAEFKQEQINIKAIEAAIKKQGLDIEARSTENEVVGV